MTAWAIDMMALVCAERRALEMKVVKFNEVMEATLTKMDATVRNVRALAVPVASNETDEGEVEEGEEAVERQEGQGEEEEEEEVVDERAAAAAATEEAAAAVAAEAADDAAAPAPAAVVVEAEEARGAPSAAAAAAAAEAAEAKVAEAAGAAEAAATAEVGPTTNLDNVAPEPSPQ